MKVWKVGLSLPKKTSDYAKSISKYIFGSSDDEKENITINALKKTFKKARKVGIDKISPKEFYYDILDSAEKTAGLKGLAVGVGGTVAGVGGYLGFKKLLKKIKKPLKKSK